jgi:hypothetical protein
MCGLVLIQPESSFVGLNFLCQFMYPVLMYNIEQLMNMNLISGPKFWKHSACMTSMTRFDEFIIHTLNVPPLNLMYECTHKIVGNFNRAQRGTQIHQLCIVTLHEL